MKCPKCNDTTQLIVQGIEVNLVSWCVDENGDITEAMNEDNIEHYAADYDDAARCCACNHKGTAKDFGYPYQIGESK